MFYFPFLLLSLQKTSGTSESGRRLRTSPTQQLHIRPRVAPATLIFISAQIIYITIIGSVSLFFPSLGVSSLRVLMNGTNVSSNAPFRSHVSIIHQIKAAERKKRGISWSMAAPGTDGSLPVTYLLLPLPFSISKHEVFT